MGCGCGGNRPSVKSKLGLSSDKPQVIGTRNGDPPVCVVAVRSIGIVRKGNYWVTGSGVARQFELGRLELGPCPEPVA